MIKSYLRVLFDEMKTVPFFVLLALCLISFFSDAWLFFDGSQFQIQNFLNNNFNNEWDFTRTVAVMLTECFNLAYLVLGGKHFDRTVLLIKFGHTYHFFFPFFLLVYLRYKEPELSAWVRQSMMFYVMSLAFFLGTSFLFFVTEMKIAHTFSWLILFAFRSQSESSGNKVFKDSFLWTMAILSLFTYPITIVPMVLAFVSQFLPFKDHKGNGRGDWRPFFGILIAASIGLLFYYHVLFPNQTSFYVAFLKPFMSNSTGKFMLYSFVLIILVRPFAKLYYWLLLPVLLFAYIYGDLFEVWEFNPARLVGVGGLVFFEIAYIFLPYFKKIDFVPEVKIRMYVVSALVIPLLVYYSYRIHQFNNKVIALLDETPRQIGFGEAYERLGSRDAHFFIKDRTRTVTICLQLMRGQKNITSYIEKRDEAGKDFFDETSSEWYRARAAEKDIGFGVIFNKKE